MQTQAEARAPSALDMGEAAAKPYNRDSTTKERVLSDLVTEGVFANAQLLRRFGEKSLCTPLAITESVLSLREAVKEVHRGDLRSAETVLVSQALALNMMFGTLAMRAEANIGHNAEVTDRYMRLALKCQAQSARTLETLATLKNPPTVFARQANIAQQQVVNNGTPHAPAVETRSPPTGLCEDSDGERMDFRAPSTPSHVDSHLAAVGKVDRPA